MLEASDGATNRGSCASRPVPVVVVVVVVVASSCRSSSSSSPPSVVVRLRRLGPRRPRGRRGRRRRALVACSCPRRGSRVVVILVAAAPTGPRRFRFRLLSAACSASRWTVPGWARKQASRTVSAPACGRVGDGVGVGAGVGAASRRRGRGAASGRWRWGGRRRRLRDRLRGRRRGRLGRGLRCRLAAGAGVGAAAGDCRRDADVVGLRAGTAATVALGRAPARGRTIRVAALGGLAPARRRRLRQVDHGRLALLGERLRRRATATLVRVLERAAPEVPGQHGDGHETCGAQECPGRSHRGPEYSVLGGCPWTGPTEGWRTGLEPATTGTTTRGSTN